MKKLIAIILLITSLCLMLASCNTSTTSTDDTQASGDTSELKRESDAPLISYEPKMLITHSTWKEFSDHINNEVFKTNSDDDFKSKVLNKSFTIDGYETSSLEYVEYDPREGSTESDWEFSVYWKKTQSKESNAVEIRHDVIYIANGVDTVAATRGYSVFDEDDNVYVRNIDNGKTSYVCLLSDKVFMRIVIEDKCEKFDDNVNQLIDYALEIKSYINTGVTK